MNRLKQDGKLAEMDIDFDSALTTKDKPKTFDLLSSLSRKEINAVVAAVSPSDTSLDRCVATMVGMALGDALGHPLEFTPATDVSGSKGMRFYLDTLTYDSPKNAFQLKPGQWTDDASMGLCLADSFIALGGKFSGSDQRARYWNWWFKGMNNAFLRDHDRGCSASVGLGGNIAKSLFSIKKNERPTSKYESNSEDAGIGSLMRLAAVPIVYRDPRTAALHAVLSSETTHPGPLAGEACRFFAFLLCVAINWKDQEARIREGCTTNFDILTSPSDDPKQFVEMVVEVYVKTELTDILEGPNADAQRRLKRLLLAAEPDDSTERNWNWKSTSLDIERVIERRGNTYNGYPVSPGYFGAFSLDGLAIALWSIYHTTSFGEALEKCINVRGDADSTGAIAGQLAGAIYGYRRIKQENPQMLQILNQWDNNGFALRGCLLHHISEKNR